MCSSILLKPHPGYVINESKSSFNMFKKILLVIPHNKDIFGTILLDFSVDKFPGY